MTIRHLWFGAWAVAWLLAGEHRASMAAAPSDTLMSSATRGYVSIADLAAFSANWQQTQIGQLFSDKAMQPFVQDVKRQLQRKLSGVHDKLGIELSDLKEVASGEVAIGMVERPDSRAAVALTVDVAGREPRARELLAEVDRELLARKAKKSRQQSGGVELTVYDVPPQSANDVARQAVFCLHQDMLLGSDSRAELEEMLSRMGGAAGDRLADVTPYQATMERCRREARGLQPEVRWYVDPLGYARAVRSLNRGERRLGKDYLQILTDQGFDALQGVGGYVNLAVGGAFELLHRTAVYAPPVAGASDKYRLGMRILEFPNSADLAPQSWIPRKLATYRTLNFDVDNGFAHFNTLFNAVAGYPDAFEGVLEGLERDPFGPQVRVKPEFIDHLGDRVTMLTDYDVPITTKSERFLFMIEVKNEAAVIAAIDKFMGVDPHAHRREVAGKQVWEIIQPEDEFSELEIGFGDLDPLAPAPSGRPAASERADFEVVQNSAVCVHDGHLLVASHVDFLEKVLTAPLTDDALPTAGDYREVQLALSQLMSGPVAASFFVRTDEAYRPTYELLRQGKMPESETLLGRFLNRVLTPPEDEDEGIPRKQKIDARELPSFEMVRRYFSPGGALVRSEADGWFIVGATLTKQAPQARAPSAGEARY
ncbi:MAG: hypothetical protein KDB00_07265 [Planctomycetales bacterium]|nr:hypothetical protein [Planctomycetales bacterium]